jgi:rod shape determining protein RodA
VVVEPDLGSTLVILGLGAYLILNLKPSFKYIIFSLIAILLFLPVSYQLLKPYQKERIQTFLSPNSDPLGSSYHHLPAIIAVGSGKLLGKGLGKGTQSHLHFLPEKDTDFFFASTVEELGFLGTIFIFLNYLFISMILLRFSGNSREDDLKIIFLGTFFAIFIQAIIHIGINLGLFPVTGITLPFMSTGGSSLISFWILLGFASSAVNQTKEDHSIYLK